MRLVALLCSAAGCASLTGQPEEKCTELAIELLVHGGSMLNVNVEGQSMPVEVRAYFLKERDAIEQLDFDSVWQRAEDSLGPSLLGSTAFTVFPGEEKITTLAVPTATSYLAVVGLFRQIEGEQWRKVVDVRTIGERCKPGDLHVPVRASLEDNRVIAQERIE
jgi:type VI secretion system protein VasD